LPPLVTQEMAGNRGGNRRDQRRDIFLDKQPSFFTNVDSLLLLIVAMVGNVVGLSRELTLDHFLIMLITQKQMNFLDKTFTLAHTFNKGNNNNLYHLKLS
jgi:hypothetical protein